ncbi:enoyl-CoA hydratase/isomerase family protein [Sphingomonas sp.]|uniref:enoyl-CoA hydratase/isomerase family protein n=1 Tax=Sphingomonas sp. TaxID=28214 RepID=UPI000DB05058|nr:enoyl-CoA hydratase/isomerase family protein [Sphingomonas sp.]PZU09240.1 MAG: enoyl-CoA hydratase [Sphingomonas sp.]
MIELTHESGIARVTIRRPAARNALSIALWGELAERIGEAASIARVILLRGEGGSFSAGADLGELAGLATDRAARTALRLAMRAGIEAVAASPIPVVAGIEGGCFGAAVGLAVACDIRVAGPHATFGVPPARFGISYPPQDVARIVARIGAGQASRLLLGAETIDAGEAVRIGLVDLLAEDGGEAIARAIAANVPESVGLLRRKIAGMETAEAEAAFEASFGSDAFAAVAAGIRAKRAQA